jgi:hypothetical protein
LARRSASSPGRSWPTFATTPIRTTGREKAHCSELIVLICGVGLPWMEYAPDGTFRRRPQA